MSLNLLGNKSHPPKDFEGRPSATHASIYTAEDVAAHPDVQLTRGGLVLFAGRLVHQVLAFVYGLKRKRQQAAFSEEGGKSHTLMAF